MHRNNRGNASQDASPAVVARLQSLLGRDALLLPWPLGSKGTKRKWRHLTLEAMSDPAYLAKLAKGNIGVAQGKVKRLCSIDIDHDDEIDGFLHLNPALACSLQSKGARGCNCWLRVEGGIPRLKPIKTRDGEKWGELRGEGAQTIIYGQHPSGCHYQFLNHEHPVLFRVHRSFGHRMSYLHFLTERTVQTETEGTDRRQRILKR